MAESLTASEGAQKDRTKSQPQHSLTSLLGSATRKPRLSKREKRRKTPSLGEKRSETTPSSQGLEVVLRVVEIGDDSEKENGNKKKKKKEKRKIDEAGLESGGAESIENVVAKKSKKKKLEREEAGLESGGSGLVESGVAKKSEKKKKKKDENGGVKEGEKSANGVSELGGMESIMATDGYASCFSFCLYAYAFSSCVHFVMCLF